MKYRKQQKVSVVMTQNETNCTIFYVARVAFINLWVFLLVPLLGKKKKRSLKDLLNTTENIKFRKQNTFIHSLLYHSGFLVLFWAVLGFELRAQTC
jgi:hypothetical protein